PKGVGPMEIGDRVRVEIEGIGQLENTVISRLSQAKTKQD
ncbi:MAG: 5-oxo-1,2,5-tricarboxylic-3-penten acid decarboxylase, partial [Moorea sp. SIO2I5]|nr:5-oxo-1,2,5-tricarboxylic-3-penten acid decarboxylase [Moorena sp. SIO2I5]